MVYMLVSAGQDLVKEAGVDSSIIPIAIIPLSNGGKSKSRLEVLGKRRKFYTKSHQI